MECELFNVAETDRKYVASEILAFLYYFLSRLTCPVRNRPTAHCLVGPSWGVQQWSAAFRRSGIFIKRFQWEKYDAAVAHPAEALTSVSVVGGICIGETTEIPAKCILDLAELANVDFLTLRLISTNGETLLHSIQLIPDLQNFAVLEAVQSL